MKIVAGEVTKGESVMADKGFAIKSELKELGLELNIPPFLNDKPGFDEYDVIKTQTIAQHRIHVERVMGKAKRFRIFHSVIQYYPATKKLTYKKLQPAIWHHIYPDIRNYSA